MHPLLNFFNKIILFSGSAFAVVILHSNDVVAQKTFDFNTNCQIAYKEIVQLKLNNGQRLLNSEKAAHPDNLIPYFLENYIDFFTLFFNEDPQEYKMKIKNLEIRLDKL